MADTTKYDRYGSHSIIGKDADTKEVSDIYVDSEKKTLRVSLYVYDTDTLSWVRAQQGITELDVSALDTIVNTTANTHWSEQRFDFDGGDDIVYIGKHETLNASTSATGWTITKYSYSSNKVSRIQTYNNGTWDNRATYF
jgi:2-keto-3-deoxy-galactonokinase